MSAAKRRASAAKRRATVALSVFLVALGSAVLVETAVVGGELGYLLGGMLFVAGVLRLALVRAA